MNSHRHFEGYAQRDKITKALRSRSDAIQTALKAYNKAAAALNPPRTQLNFADIIKMVSLAEFDILRDGTTDIRKLPWTNEASREAMRLHFGLKRAYEEIHRLNVEIRRQVTYMYDEESLYSSVASSELAEVNPSLADYISKERDYRNAIFSNISWYLYKTSRLPAFSGDLSPGTRAGNVRSRVSDAPAPIWMSYLEGKTPEEEKGTGDDEVHDDAPVVEEEENIVVQYFEQLSTEDN
jgi:hypothetical protein